MGRFLPVSYTHLDGGQGVRDRVGGAVDVEASVVLAEPAGGDADAEAAAHLRLDRGDPVLIALIRVIGQVGDVILLRVMGLEVRAVEGIEGDADRVGTVKAVAGGIFNDLPDLFRCV